MFISSHKQKNYDVHKLFSVVPESEKLIDGERHLVAFVPHLVTVGYYSMPTCMLCLLVIQMMCSCWYSVERRGKKEQLLPDGTLCSLIVLCDVPVSF